MAVPSCPPPILPCLPPQRRAEAKLYLDQMVNRGPGGAHGHSQGQSQGEEGDEADGAAPERLSKGELLATLQFGADRCGRHVVGGGGGSAQGATWMSSGGG